MRPVQKENPLKRRIVSILLAVSLLVLPVGAADPPEGQVERLLEQMSLQEKLAQMLMPTFRTDPAAADGIGEDVARCLQEHCFAGVALFAEELETTRQAVRRTDAMQAANASVPGRPQLLTAVDQEGGSITRLGQGTMTCGNMALGAVGDPAVTEAAAAILGSEIMACGLNVDFAPVLDVNSNPANPVIGVRSFSDDPAVVAGQGEAFLTAMRGTGAIACLKHFPGHGDTAADSHTGLPRVEKSREALLREELLPFARCINAGAEMIMTAHIQYPAIEPGTWPSRATGEEITLPATLSPAVITDLLRGELGFTGVVVTDALGMDAIRTHFDPVDSARLAIEAGVDILLMPPVDAAELDRFLGRLCELTESGEISAEKVDAAVARILRLKQRHGLLEPYDAGQLEARLENAAAVVGCPEHHDAEWKIAKRAVTLVKNDGVLPYSAPLGRTVVLTAAENEISGMEYAVGRLRDEQRLPEDAELEIHALPGAPDEQLAAWIAGADHVIAVSELYGSAGLYGSASARIDTLIALAHDNGADVTVLSAFLPYDCARFPDADAIALCWLDRSMSEDPRVTDTPTQYGPNLPASLYLLLSGESPRGALSVQIPALDEDGGYADEILYPRGHGLRYPGAENEPVEKIIVISDDFGDDVEEFSEYHGNISDYHDLNGRAWYYADVKRVLAEGLMTGASDGAFAPGAPVSSNLALDALFRLSGAQEAYPGPLAWARELGLLTGLRPEETLTRRQLAGLLLRYAQAAAFADGAEDPMDWAQAHLLLRPRAHPVPEGPVTRAVLAHALCALARRLQGA